MPAVNLDQIYEQMGECIEMRSDLLAGMHLTLAVPLTMRLVDSEPAWLLLVGGPSTGKTMLLQNLRNSDRVSWIDDLTPNTLLSGFRDEQQLAKGEAMTLAGRAQSLDKKTLLIPDLTVVINKGQQSREIFDQFRLLFDGSFTKEYGNKVVASFNGKVNLLGGVTEAIDTIITQTVALGERFLQWRMSPLSESQIKAIAMMAILGDKGKKRSHEKLSRMCRDMVDGGRFPHPEISEEQARALGAYSTYTTSLRSHSARPSKSAAVLAPPQQEGPARVARQLASIAKGLAMVRRATAVSTGDMYIVKQIALCSMTKARMLCLAELVDAKYNTKKVLSHYSLMDPLKITADQALNTMYDLYRCRVVNKYKSPSSGDDYSWGLTEEASKVIEQAEMVEMLLEEVKYA